MEIKICGIRRKEDIEIVNKYKPDYIGFIFAESRRQVSPLLAKELTALTDKSIKTVGVFVNSLRKDVEAIALEIGLDAVQLHGDEEEDYIKKLNLPCEIWKAVRVRGGEIPDFYGADRILLDKYSDKEYGGGGEPFNWSAAGRIRTKKKLVLAGGLTKDNVLKGIKIFSPVCVDVSSSVETDGYKDENKIREFINIVRNRAE